MAAATNPIDRTPGKKGAVGGAAPPAKAPATPAQTAAHKIVNSFLAQYGLQALGNWAYNQYTSLGGGSNALQIISTEIVDQPAFQQRFPAYKALAAKGEAMTPAQMLAYEQQAKEIFHSAGIPSGFYDTPAELATFMENNVSATELKNRVDLAQQAAISAPADVRDQLERLYGIPATGGLTAYFLNPDKALPVLQQTYTASQIAADASRTGFGQLTAGQATHIAQLGETDPQAQQDFAKLGSEQGLFQQQVAGEGAIDQETQLAAQFDNQAAAQLRIKQRQQARLADFQGNAGFQATSKGLTGLGVPDRSAGS